jgi:exodeoxyribonuclease V alpha subunit
LILEGEWAAYKGEREFSFRSARLDVPTDPRDALRYVCARTTGLGPAMEEMIWAHAGAGWRDIAEGAVPRLSGKLYASFRLQSEALTEKSEEARVVAALMGKGATQNMACSAWEKWKDETLGVVNADPYRLAELDNYGFRDVDAKVRRAYGITDADKRRIRAAVVYALRRITDAGDTVAAWADLYAQTTAMRGGFADEVSDCTRELFDEGVLKAFPESEGVSLAADWRAENDIWDFVEAATTQGVKHDDASAGIG